MSGDHLSSELVNDHADGLLDASAAAAVERHLADCRACASEVGAIRALRAEAAALRREIQPGLDLRPAIRAERAGARQPARVASGPARGARGRAWDRRGRIPTVLAAAAAVVIIAGGSLLAVTWWADGPERGTPMAAETPAPAGTVLALDEEYERAARDLTATVSAAEGALSPEALRVLRSTLTTVDRAVEESRAALREDPSSPVVRELVLAAHRQRLDVLRRAAAVAAELGEAS